QWKASVNGKCKSASRPSGRVPADRSVATGEVMPSISSGSAATKGNVLREGRTSCACTGRDGAPTRASLCLRSCGWSTRARLLYHALKEEFTERLYTAGCVELSSS